jgi:hypothetical protein
LERSNLFMARHLRRRWLIGRKILLLVGDRPCRDLLLRLLGEADVTVVTHPPEVPTLVAAHRYGLVIVTNFGESPWEAIDVVPAERDWPALFLSGHWDKELEAICALKRLPRLPAPLDADSFLRAVSEALRGPDTGVAWGTSENRSLQ